jgi:eukaryotic-like serine/threonine-protein kinase
MDPQRWEHLKDLVAQALELSPDQRLSFLAKVCGDDAGLRSEVEGLLKHHEEAGSFLEGSPSQDLVAPAPPKVSQGTFSAGEMIAGRFRIVRFIGRGGMGVVYAAQDTKLPRMVALKFLPDVLAKSPEGLERFKREAHAASVLNHPNICTIYDVDEHGAQPFIAMELLEGQTLRQRIGSPRPRPKESLESRDADSPSPIRASLPVHEVLDLAIQIADGLDAAHTRGIIHRDIKPANVFITKRGDAKILDFGLAKFILREGPVPVPPDDASNRSAGEVPQDTPTSTIEPPHLTIVGAAMGTAAYMSPEQARGEQVDARTDLFSFGAVLYEMATGRQAFSGANSAEIRDAILNREATPVRILNPAVDLRLQAIIEKALEKDREVRYQHASEMRADLKRLRRDSGPGRAVAAMSSSPPEGLGTSPLPVGMPSSPDAAVGTPPLQRRTSDPRITATPEKRQRKSILALAAGACAIVVVFVYFSDFAVRHSSAPSVALEITRLTDSGDIGKLDISPDGKFVAYQRFTPGKETIWIKHLATDSDIQIATLDKGACLNV